MTVTLVWALSSVELAPSVIGGRVVRSAIAAAPADPLDNARVRQAGAARTGRSVWDGVFSTAQARRGEQKFAENCGFCHPLTLVGPDDHVDGWSGEPLVGDQFLRRFRDAFTLFDVMRSTMPATAPGELGSRSYVDLISFILEANKFPAGDKELSFDADSLKQIRIEPRPSQPQPSRAPASPGSVGSKPQVR